MNSASSAVNGLVGLRCSLLYGYEQNFIYNERPRSYLADEEAKPEGHQQAVDDVGHGRRFTGRLHLPVLPAAAVEPIRHQQTIGNVGNGNAPPDTVGT